MNLPSLPKNVGALSSSFLCSNVSYRTPGLRPGPIPLSRSYSSLARDAIAMAAYTIWTVLFAIPMPLSPWMSTILAASFPGSTTYVSAWNVMSPFVVNSI
jgi:hypothetical protein